MVDSFWTGGPEAYAEGLKQHYQELLRELYGRLAECRDETERHDIEQDIATTQNVYKDQLNEIDELIF